MLVSIIISNYNYAAYVRQAIDSALNQTYSPIEVIVVDDGSTDNSREILAAYGDRIRTVCRENGGPGAVYNTGWAVAKGDIISYLDADDVIMPDAARKCVDALKGNDAVKAQFMLQKVDKDLKPIEGLLPTYPGIGKNIRRDMLLWGFYVGPPATGNFYRRSFLEMIMPAPESSPKSDAFYLPADGYLASLAGVIGNIVTLHEVLGLYRVHGTNLSDAGKVDSLPKLRRLFMRDYIREEYNMIWAGKWNLPCNADRARFHPTVCKQRFLAYRIAPETHPVPQDTYWNLLGAGLWGAIRFPYLSLRKRIFIFCGFIAIGVMPHSMLGKMISAVAKPEQRKGILSLFSAN